MKIAVTVRSGDIGGLRQLLDEVRSRTNLTVLEAPSGLDYPYPFPIVMVNSSSGWDRHFGDEAVDLLREFAKAD